MNDRQDERDLERLSKLLDGLPAPQPSSALLRAVAEIPLRHPQPAPGLGAWWPFRSTSRLALSMVAIALLGALTGLNADADDEAGVYDGADDWSELSALNLAADLDQELAP